jgi:hypothetical protein
VPMRRKALLIVGIMTIHSFARASELESPSASSRRSES